MAIVEDRFTVDNSEDVVVFLIGARINRWWLLPIALPILASMGRMLDELAKDPSTGFLGVQNLGMGGMVQYWRSVEHLNRYAHDRTRVHRPAWTAFMSKLFKNRSVGIWHETFIVRGGQYESIYTNMPRWGMGLFKELVPATGGRASAGKRLDRPEPEDAVPSPDAA